MNKTLLISLSVLLGASLSVRVACARRDLDFTVDGKDVPCDASTVQAVVWNGNDTRMSLAQLAAYCAPVLWFSPDEPLLSGARGKLIMIPTSFPFEAVAETPVVYYRVRNILQRADAKTSAYTANAEDRGASIIDLEDVAGIDLDFFFYYPSEAGLGVHKHDVECAQFQLAVWRREDCPGRKYNLVVTRVVGKAHGLQWYDNTLGVDEYTRFPMHLMVEEGKHATCTDKNADGYFTPGYDVNRRVNDAWGVRDVIRGGTLYSSGFQSWMAKVRQEGDRVFPPLPDDSPLRAQYVTDGEYAAEHAVYALRPFPSAEHAEPDLEHFISDKGDPDWPALEKNNGAEQFSRWIGSEPFVKSLSVAFYADGDIGVSFVFPLFIVKGFEEPLAGGFITNRVILKDDHLRDLSWMLQYTPSASRWLDPYFAAGVEVDHEEIHATGEKTSDTNCVIETGLKFRVDVTHSPFKFLTKVTDFWGLRFGIKSDGFFDIDRLRYVLEFGAGTW